MFLAHSAFAAVKKDENEDRDEKMLLTASTFALGGIKASSDGAEITERERKRGERERGQDDGCHLRFFWRKMIKELIGVTYFASHFW